MIKKNIVFRCDGDDFVGFGHVSRCLNVANNFPGIVVFDAIFFGNFDDYAARKIKNAGHEIINLKNSSNNYDHESETLSEYIKLKKIDVLFLDTRNQYSEDEVGVLRSSPVLIVTLDDPFERRKQVDLAFYPPVESVVSMEWENFCGTKFIGWDYYPLSEKIIPQRRIRNFRNRQDNIKIIVSMGSIDPLDYTSLILSSLLKTEGSFEIEVIIGPNNTFKPKIQALANNTEIPITLVENCHNMIDRMSSADIGFIAFGVSAYEAASLGLPTMLFSISEDHFSSAKSFIDAGMSVHAWPSYPKEDASLNVRVQEFLLDQIELETKSRNAFVKVDGLGASRICSEILKSIEEQDRSI